MRALPLLLVTMYVTYVAGWAETFNFFDCYETAPQDRMAKTMDSLIGMLEKYEGIQGAINFDEMAEAIIKRYRKDGIIFDPTNEGQQWQVSQTEEVNKQDLLQRIIQPSTTLAEDSFTPREECGLHMMLSHAIDTYPHLGVDIVWDDNSRKYHQQGLKRSKRSYSSSSSSSFKSLSSSGSSSSSSSSSSSKTSGSSYYSGSSNSGNGYNLPSDVEPAEHPLEYGVIETPYGPVAAGTLLTGLMVLNDNREQTIATILGTDSDYMPQEMSSKTISKVYAATLSGDLAQVGLAAEGPDNYPTVSPKGRYNNCSTCAQLFSYENDQWSFLSRAEIFAGIDVLIMYSVNQDSNVFNSLSLSEILRHYYSEKGLPGLPEVKACNRKQLYSQLDQDKINEQSLSFIYAYQNYFKTSQNLVEIHQDNYQQLEVIFVSLVGDALKVMNDFISGSSFYDDDNYQEGCYYGVSSSYFQSLSGRTGQSGGDSPQNDGMADIVAVYQGEGTEDLAFLQLQIIADIARRMDVGTDRSRMMVISGRDGNEMDMGRVGNYTNVGDWACNLTKIEDRFGSNDNPSDVLSKLSSIYNQVYNASYYDMDVSSGNSQVVFWQITATFPEGASSFNRSLTDFRLTYPDVNIIFMGNEIGTKQGYMEYEDSFISYKSGYYETTLADSVDRIKASPRFFVYPACDPNDSTEAYNYDEGNHQYKGYVYPNFTTYIKIPPQTFFFSETLKLRFDSESSSKVKVCVSRTNRYALEDYCDQPIRIYDSAGSSSDNCKSIECQEDSSQMEFTMQYLCDSYLSECDPIYVSITGTDEANSGSYSISRSSSTSGNAKPPAYINQIGFTLTHDGMICGASGLAPAVALLLSAFLLQKLLQ